MPIANVIKLGTVVLGCNANGNSVTSIARTKVPGTKKSRFNETLTLARIPGRSKEWRVTIIGRLLGTSKDSDRTTLQGYDDAGLRRFEDGIVDGDYVIEPGSFVETDAGDSKTEIGYSMTLLQNV